MIYEYVVYQAQLESELFWVAESKVLDGCVGQGKTSAQAVAELEENERIWLESAKESNIPIPNHPIHSLHLYSGKVALRISPLVHKQAAENANYLGISLNQYIGDSLLSYNKEVCSYKYVDPSEAEVSSSRSSSSNILRVDFHSKGLIAPEIKIKTN